jgi:cytochrome c oxidase cbb3-type subunit 4
MDINDLRVVVTVVSFIVFLGIVVLAYSRKRKRDFDEAAQLPFRGEDFGDDAANAKTGKRR